MINKRGQIWIETVIYTLIALVMIGAVLSFVQPKIQEIQDKAIIDQSLKIMAGINEEMDSVLLGGAGNKRIVSIELKKGDIAIDCTNDEIIYMLADTRSRYSEPGQDILYGNIIINTEKTGNLNIVTLKLDYKLGNLNGLPNLDLRCENQDEKTLTLTKSTTPYKFEVTNNGALSGEAPMINIQVA